MSVCCSPCIETSPNRGSYLNEKWVEEENATVISLTTSQNVICVCGRLLDDFPDSICY